MIYNKALLTIPFKRYKIYLEGESVWINSKSCDYFTDVLSVLEIFFVFEFVMFASMMTEFIIHKTSSASNWPDLGDIYLMQAYKA